MSQQKLRLFVAMSQSLARLLGFCMTSPAPRWLQRLHDVCEFRNSQRRGSEASSRVHLSAEFDKGLSQRSLQISLAFPCEIFQFWIHAGKQTDLQGLDVFYSDAILLDWDNPLISQESLTGALLPPRSLSSMSLDCTSSHPELLPSKHIMIP